VRFRRRRGTSACLPACGRRGQWKPTCFASSRLEYARSNHLESRRNILTTLKTVTDTATELGNEAKETMEQLGRNTGRRIDSVRAETGAALHTAASSVRATGRQGAEALDNFSTGAADRLDATAEIVENNDLSDVLTSLRRYGRQHLAGTLVAAAAIGFLTGSAIRSSKHRCSKCGQGSAGPQV